PRAGGSLAMRLAGAPATSGRAPYRTGRPRVVHRAPAPVAHEPLAAREHGLAAQEVRGRARLAAHGGGRSPDRRVVGRASGAWAARGPQVLLEQPAGCGLVG